MTGTAVREVARDLPAAAAEREPGAGLARAALLYIGVVIAVITLAPFDFAVPSRFQVRADVWSVFDVVTNVLLFLPVGFLATLARRDERSGAAWRALLVGALLSAGIECAQLFEAMRYPSPWDVIANALGASLGAALTLRLRRRLDPAALVGRLALQLPLVGLVYLLVPLGWLRALTAGAAPARAWALLMLGLFGASVLGAVQRRYLGPGGVASPRGMALVAGTWFFVLAGPALGVAPALVAGGTLFVAAFAWQRAAASPHATDGERRFEAATLRRAAPFLAAYLALLPLTAVDAAGPAGHAYILGLVESVAAFTVLGYAVAESFGRRELSPVRGGALVAAAALAVVVGQALLHGAGALAVGDAAVAAIVGTLAALYGAWLYGLQRAQVRALVEGARAAAA